jgi:DeoR/GlpR family transcriptional regulator of sugar metabolism
MSGNRHHQIIGYLTDKGFASVDELAQQVGISSVTIRRDLASLEADGVVKRVHGGATLADSVAFGIPYSWRRHQNADAKRAIAAHASSLVTQGQTVFLDAGTTCALLSELLPATIRARIITHSIENVLQLRAKPALEIIAAGGRYERELGSCIGDATEQTLGQFHADISFLAAAHVNAEQGLVNNHLGERAIKRIIHAQCNKCYLLVDSSKFGVHGVQSTVGIEEFRGEIITDSGLSDEQRKLFEARGVKLTIVDV